MARLDLIVGILLVGFGGFLVLAGAFILIVCPPGHPEPMLAGWAIILAGLCGFGGASMAFDFYKKEKGL